MNSSEKNPQQTRLIIENIIKEERFFNTGTAKLKMPFSNKCCVYINILIREVLTNHGNN